MTFDEKKQAAFDALDVVDKGMHDATSGLPDTRSACRVIERRLREAIDECGEDKDGEEVDRLKRRTSIARLMYYDVAEAAEFIPEDMAKVRQECYRLQMAIDDLVYA